MTTIREWFSYYEEKPDLIKFPLVEKDDYGLEAWVGVPTLVYKFNDPAIQIWLDKEFDDGFGAQGVPSFIAWSVNRVYFVHEYDGATSLSYVPRNP